MSYKKLGRIRPAGHTTIRGRDRIVYQAMWALTPKVMSRYRRRLRLQEGENRVLKQTGFPIAGK